MNKFIKYSIFIYLFYTSICFANEKSISQQWCADHDGCIEVVFDDGTRCDCVTDEYAIEFEYAQKWYEAVGQSLHYAYKSGKKPGIVLILKHINDLKYSKRLTSVIKHNDLPIKLWEINLE